MVTRPLVSITAVPRQVETPAVLRYDVDEEYWPPFVGLRHRTRERTPLPEDVFLRELLELDMAAVEEMAKLPRDGAPYFDAPGFEQVSSFCRSFGPLVERETWTDHLSFLIGDPAMTPWEVEQIQYAWFEREWSDEYGFLGQVMHVGAFALAAKNLRNAVRIWLAFAGEMSFDDAYGSLEKVDWLHGLPLGTVPMVEESEENARIGAARAKENAHIDAAGWFLEEVFASGLQRLSPRMSVRRRDSRRPLDRPELGTYEAICAQLYNAIASGADYRRCERCGRLFERSRGNSRQGKYWKKGVKFCSLQCQRAAAVARYRERRSRQKP
jgi:hypothetical protein